MKKGALSLLILITLSGIHASNNSINIGLSPYSFQIINTESGITDNSSYGWGAKVGYRYCLSESFFIGGDTEYSRFSYANLYGNERYNVISFLTKAGYLFQHTKTVFLMCDIGAGIDVRLLHGISRVNPSFGAYLGFGFEVTESVLFTTGADVKLGIQPRSKDFAIVSNIGIAVGL